MALPTHVHVIGAGLIGASIGMALRPVGVEVTIEDASPTAAALARDLGAGRESDDAAPDLVVVATPPDVAADVVAGALADFPEAVVTDVASVKAVIADELARTGVDLSRYVGSHPMAGRERSGAVAAQADLFQGRTWVICAGDARSQAVAMVSEVATAVGSVVVRMEAREHDEAVAAVSHVPQIAASLVAARLRGMTDTSVALAGQGVRDVTRIAASDPTLWTQILAGNAEALAPVLRDLGADLQRLSAAVDALAEGREHGARAVLANTIAEGQIGHARIPGKHGSTPTVYSTLIVVVPDRPGMLGTLFNDVGDAGINLEDLRFEHGVGREVGALEIDVVPTVVERCRDVLREKGWIVHE